MIEQQFVNIFTKKLTFTPTRGQKDAVEALSDFVVKGKEGELFLLKGYAGTGKTTLVAALIKALWSLRMKAVLLAPTGRAAKVLSGYAKRPAFTIHKKIYRQKSSKDGFGEFVLDKNLHSNTIFIVDEASMIANAGHDASVFGSGRLLDDFISYVREGKNCKALFVGDTAQLPPVHSELSPALDFGYLEAYGNEVTQVVLTEVVRQASVSGILKNATTLRQQMLQLQDEPPLFDITDFDDVKAIRGNSLIEALESAYDRFGMDQVIVVTRSNKRANLYNKGIRNSILWREERISQGDLLMVVKNNYFWSEEYEEIDFIANGDIAELVSIDGYQERYGHQFADVTLRFHDYDDLEVDCKIMLDTLDIETASLTAEHNKKFFYNVFEDYQHLKTKKKRVVAVKEDPYFNAMQVKFAYAVTCHKAQGGQWKTVFIDQGYFKKDMWNLDYARWLYTAFTRPTELLYLVNFDKMFVGEQDLDVLI